MFARRTRFVVFWISLLIGTLLFSGCTTELSTPSPIPKELEETVDIEAYPDGSFTEVTSESEAYPAEMMDEVPFETEAYPVETDIDDVNLNPLPPDPLPHNIQTSDGVELQGTFYPAERVNAPLIVLMHWARGDQHDWTAIAPWLQNRGVQPAITEGESWLSLNWFPAMPENVSFNVFTFTFRNCEGGCQSINPEGWLLDIEAVTNYMQELENVDLSQMAMIGASIGADGAVYGCDEYNTEYGGCRGAFSFSPGGYLNISYPDAVAILTDGSPPASAWCLYAVGDANSAEACQNAAGMLYQAVEYEGNAHGMSLISPDLEPDPLTKILEFLFEIGICDACS